MESTSLFIAGALIAVVLIAVSFLIVILHRGKVKNLFKRAEYLKEHVKYDQALKLYQKIIRKLEPGKGKPETEKINFLGKSYHACGTIYDHTGAKDKAYEYYKRAIQSSIPITTGVVVFSATYCIERQIIDDYSVNIFIHHLILKPADRLSRQINDLLSKSFYIDEKSPKESITKTLKLCERIFNSKLQNISGKKSEEEYFTFEWANFYAGLAYYLNKDFKKAIANLNLASKSKNSRPVSRYWLGMAMMGHLQSDIDKSLTVESARYQALIDLLTSFIATETNDPELINKRNTATHKLGVFIVKWILGLANKPGYQLSEEQTKILTRSISYLNSSVQENIKDDDLGCLYLGRAYSLLKDSVHAIENYQKALTELPSDDLLYLYLGQENFILQNYDIAGDYLVKCLNINAKNIEARKLALKICILKSQFREAESHYLILAEQKEADIESKYHYLNSLYHLQKFQEITEAVNNDPNSFNASELPQEISFYIGRAFIDIKVWKEAVKWLINLTNNPEYQYYSAYTLANLERFSEAEKVVNELNSDNSELQNRINLLSGSIYLKLEKYEKAKSSYLVLFTAQPDNTEINEALGCLYLNMGNLEEAQVHFYKAFSNNDSGYMTVLGLAQIHENWKQYQEALKFFTLAFKLREESWIDLKISILHVLLKDFSNARLHLENYMTGNAEDNSCMFYLGYTYARLGQYDQAIKIWEKLSKKHPDNERLKLNILEVIYYYGVNLISLKQYDEAIIEWEIYIEYYSNDSKTKCDLAQLYFNCGLEKLDPDKPESLTEVKEIYIKKALEHDKNNPKYLFYLALIEFALKNHSGAQAILEMLNSLDPVNEKYRYYLSLALLETGNRNGAISLLTELMNEKSANGYSLYSRIILANEHIRELNYNNAVTLLEQLV
jgi:tetratricopeptide (TPR) repeat protein